MFIFRKLHVMEKQQLVQHPFQWPTAQNVLIVVNVVVANVYPFVKLKIYKHACVTQLQILAKDVVEWYVMQNLQIFSETVT